MDPTQAPCTEEGSQQAPKTDGASSTRGSYFTLITSRASLSETFPASGNQFT